MFVIYDLVIHLLFLCFRYSDLDQSYSMSEGDKDEDGDEDGDEDEDEEEYVKLICHSKFL